MKSTDRIIYRNLGLTLLEILITCSVIAIIAAIAISNYSNARYKVQISKAIGDIRAIEASVNGYRYSFDVYPPSLAQVGMDQLRDPWGNDYVYQPITGDPKQKVRKDRNLHPINTDFDLYSRGRDGATNYALTAKASQDDIIRAQNGAFVDLASKK